MKLVSGDEDEVEQDRSLCILWINQHLGLFHAQPRTDEVLNAMLHLIQPIPNPHFLSLFLGELGGVACLRRHGILQASEALEEGGG